MIAARSWLLLLCAVPTLACSVVHKSYEESLAPEELPFEVGKSRLGDVLRSLGPPSRLSALSGGLVFAYEHLVTTEGSFGIQSVGNSAAFNVSGGGVLVEREILLLTFEKDGLLTSKSFGRRSENLGSGLSASFFVAADGFGSTEDIDEDGGPLEWGLGLLESPFETLNDPQNLDGGDAGLQQRGTTTNVGQHTLELD